MHKFWRFPVQNIGEDGQEAGLLTLVIIVVVGTIRATRDVWGMPCTGVLIVDYRCQSGYFGVRCSEKMISYELMSMPYAAAGTQWLLLLRRTALQNDFTVDKNRLQNLISYKSGLPQLSMLHLVCHITFLWLLILKFCFALYDVPQVCCTFMLLPLLENRNRTTSL